MFVEELVELASINGDRVEASVTRQDEWKKPFTGIECLRGRKAMNHFLQTKSSDNAIYYICGPPSMLDEAIALLKDKDVPTSNIIYEQWW